MIEWPSPAASAIRQTGTVEARIGRLHRVRTDSTQTLLADSATPYPPGSRVTLLADAIVGPAGPEPTITSYQE